MAVAFPRFLGPVPLDVVVRETHATELEITLNPIEMGADVTDHAYVQPKRFSMEAVAASRISSPALVGAAYYALVRLQESREPFDVVTGLTLYRDMLIQRISVERDVTNSRILFFRADLLEIIIVNTESRGSAQQGTPKDRASEPTDRGGVAPADVPPETPTGDGRSLVQRFRDGGIKGPSFLPGSSSLTGPT